MTDKIMSFFLYRACDPFMSSTPSFSDRLAVLPQYLIPKQALTAFAGWVAGSQWGGVTTGIVNWFVQRYNVNMMEAANPDTASYKSFNAFFTRPLRGDARPLASAAFAAGMKTR